MEQKWKALYIGTNYFVNYQSEISQNKTLCHLYFNLAVLFSLLKPKGLIPMFVGKHAVHIGSCLGPGNLGSGCWHHTPENSVSSFIGASENVFFMSFSISCRDLCACWKVKLYSELIELLTSVLYLTIFYRSLIFLWSVWPAFIAHTECYEPMQLSLLLTGIMGLQILISDNIKC